jgi:glycosyltransferase involved in cell wall biosynthesis
MQNIAIILPAFNEELTISSTIIDFNRVLPQAAIWVINNCSSDATESEAKNTLKLLSCHGGVINEPRLGKGNAVRRGFMEVEADVYVLVDADSTYLADDLPALLFPMLSNSADMVVGDRHVEGYYKRENKRALHGFGNRLVRDLVNRLFKANLSDILSGYRIFSRRFVKSYPVLVDGFDIEVDMTLHALDKRLFVVEIPVKYRDRPDGSLSKLNTVQDGLRVLNTLFNILRYYRPLFFFGTFSIIFLIIGLILGMPVVLEFIHSRHVSHVPLAILSTGVEVIAVVLATVGLVLDSMAQLDKRLFERDLLRIAVESNERQVSSESSLK